MGSSDSRSWNKHRLDGISDFLKVSADSFDGKGSSVSVSVNSIHLSEKSPLPTHWSEYPGFDHSGDSSNIFTNEPSGPDFVDNAESLRPEVTLILSPPSFSCVGKRLAGEPCGEDVDFPAPLTEVCLCDVFITFTFGEPVVQHSAPEGVDLAMKGVAPAHHFRSHLRPADAAEQTCMYHIRTTLVFQPCASRASAVLLDYFYSLRESHNEGSSRNCLGGSY